CRDRGAGEVGSKGRVRGPHQRGSGGLSDPNADRSANAGVPPSSSGGWAPRPPIEERLAAAGLPPLPRTAWLELDLDALAGNLAVIRELAGPDTAVHPVVKADAYGHGAVPIARGLAEAGADGLCVAAFDEAIQLRDAGIDLPIFVLFPIPSDLIGEARRRRIAVTAGDRRLLG